MFDPNFYGFTLDSYLIPHSNLIPSPNLKPNPNLIPNLIPKLIPDPLPSSLNNFFFSHYEKWLCQIFSGQGFFSKISILIKDVKNVT